MFKHCSATLYPGVGTDSRDFEWIEELRHFEVINESTNLKIFFDVLNVNE